MQRIYDFSTNLRCQSIVSNKTNSIPETSQIPQLSAISTNKISSSNEVNEPLHGYESPDSSILHLLQSFSSNRSIRSTKSITNAVDYKNCFCSRLSVIDKAIYSIQNESKQKSIHLSIKCNINSTNSNSDNKITTKCKSFFNDYNILSQLGESGQFGTAYKCIRKSDGLECAVKIIDKHKTDKKALKNEINIMKLLKYKYIIKLFDIYENNNKLYIVMEECCGGELFDIIQKKGYLKEKFTKKIIKMLCYSLFYLHNKLNIVYCDLKPENILFLNKNVTFENCDIKLIDFGMSKQIKNGSGYRYCRGACGTPWYTSPEVINNKYSYSADMWSLGVVLYTMLFGFPPFYIDPIKYDQQFAYDKETSDIYKLIKKGFNPSIRKGFGPWFNKDIVEIQNLSSECMDLITNLLQIDVQKRLTAQEVLQHPWFNDINLDLIGLNLTNYTLNSNKYKYKMVNLFKNKYNEIRPKYINNFQKMYEIIFCDRNGICNYKQFENVMLKCSKLKLNRLQIKQIFDKMDINSSNNISFVQFMNAFIYDHLISVDERLLNIFNLINSDINEKQVLSEIQGNNYSIYQFEM